MWHSTACDALRQSNRLEIRYDGYARVVEVHAVGCTKDGNEVMRVWQVRGGSVGNEPIGWKLLRLDEARSYGIIKESSAAPRPGYRRGDKAMQRIFCQL